MKSIAAYTRFTKFVLLFVFLVICAGSIVRVTQSGMGCPDWPECFGYLIPPTQYQQVLFRPGHAYREGQFIIHNDSLKYSIKAFTSGPVYDPADWQQYQKHNYAKFEVYQTWIEYCNRLLTGILGLLIIFHVIWSGWLFYRSKNEIFWLSFCLIVLVGFEAWLGKLVVDTRLSVFQISSHMLLALALAAIPVIILNKLSGEEKVKSRLLKGMTNLALVLLMTQVIFGTEVRGQIDVIAQSFNYTDRELWIALLNNFFTLHKYFSVGVALVCIWLCWRSLSFVQLRKTGVGILVSVLGVMAFGLTMAYLAIPVFIQPLHVLLSAILVILLFNFRLKLK